MNICTLRHLIRDCWLQEIAETSNGASPCSRSQCIVPRTADPMYATSVTCIPCVCPHQRLRVAGYLRLVRGECKERQQRKSRAADVQSACDRESAREVWVTGARSVNFTTRVHCNCTGITLGSDVFERGFCGPTHEYAAIAAYAERSHLNQGRQATYAAHNQ
jgi:hypothetical protein